MIRYSLFFLFVLCLACSGPVLEKAPGNNTYTIHPFQENLMISWSANDSNLVSLANWDQPPYNRWAWQHFRELAPTAGISRGKMEVRQIPYAVRYLDTLRFSWGPEQKSCTLKHLLDSSHTDAFLVIQDGKILMEEYWNGMEPATPHMLRSATKSMTMSLLAHLIGQRRINRRTKINEYLWELPDGGYKEARIGQVMDMQSGIRYRYGNGPADSSAELGRQWLGWHWTPGGSATEGQRRYLSSLRLDTVPGSRFLYNDADAEMLGWVMEKVVGRNYAEMFSEQIWQQLGAEWDAWIATDGLGSAIASTGMAMRLRDLGRMGLLYLDKGWYQNKQVIPTRFIDSLLPGADPRPLQQSGFSPSSPPGTAYNDLFWIPGGHDGAFAACGYGGQYLYISPEHRTVIAKFSSQGIPDGVTEQKEWAAFLAISRLFSVKN